MLKKLALFALVLASQACATRECRSPEATLTVDSAHTARMARMVAADGEFELVTETKLQKAQGGFPSLETAANAMISVCGPDVGVSWVESESGPDVSTGPYRVVCEY